MPWQNEADLLQGVVELEQYRRMEFAKNPEEWLQNRSQVRETSYCASIATKFKPEQTSEAILRQTDT